MPRSLLGWVVLIVVLILIFRNPAGASAHVKHAADSVSTFVSGLFG